MAETEWRVPGDEPQDDLPAKPYPGAMGPPRVGPPPRLSSRPEPVGPRAPLYPPPPPRPLPPYRVQAAPMLTPPHPSALPPSAWPASALPPSARPAVPPPPGAWQGTLRPPPFVVTRPVQPGPPSSRERPHYREPLPVRGGPVAIGLGVGALWMLLFGVQASGVRVYAWLTIAAAAVALVVIGVLARFGDRGVAVGAAIAVGLGLTVVGVIGMSQALTGHWLLW